MIMIHLVCLWVVVFNFKDLCFCELVGASRRENSLFEVLPDLSHASFVTYKCCKKHFLLFVRAAAETNASTEDAGVQYYLEVNCHRLSDEEKIQLWASWLKKGDIANGNHQQV
jgi:hypothetical protein